MSSDHNTSNDATIATVANGTVAMVNDTECVFYDGYWIRRYEIPSDEESARRELIDGLTKRVFHHTEPGINTPSHKLAAARAAYDREQDLERRRVNAAMLAGALLNRGSTIFGMIFQLKQRGIEIAENNELLLECESCFLEALDLGKQVRHYSGEEGLDELWGEPLKVFSTPIADYYESRYIKIAQTMAALNEITDKITEVIRSNSALKGAEKLLNEFAIAANHEIETMKTDPAIFEVWPQFVATGNMLSRFETNYGASGAAAELIKEGVELIRDGKNLMQWIAFARVPMPTTTANFIASCNTYITKANKSVIAA